MKIQLNEEAERMLHMASGNPYKVSTSYLEDLANRLIIEAARESTEMGKKWLSLTKREKQVCVLRVCSQMTNKDIAAHNMVGMETIKTQFNRAYRKLGIHSRDELLRVFAFHVTRGEIRDLERME